MGQARAPWGSPPRCRSQKRRGTALGTGWKTRLCAQGVPRDGAGSGAPSRAGSPSRHEDGQALEEGASRPTSCWHHGPVGSWGLVPRNVCSPAASQSKPALARAFPTAKRLCEHLWANESKKGGRRGRESRGDFKPGRVQEAVATCPRQEVLSPNFSGEKASQKPSLLGCVCVGVMPRQPAAPLSLLNRCQHPWAPLAPSLIRGQQS